MPSVRIEDDAFGDLRYEELAAACGLADADHARGKMARLWRQCTAELRYVLSRSMVESVLGPRGVDALVLARLGEVRSDGVRIKGTKGRIEWLEKLRSNGRKGGRPSKSNTETKRKPSGFPELNPPALVPSPALVPVQIPEGEGPPAAPPPAAPAPLALFGYSDPAPKADPIADLWAEQERLRAEVITGSRPLDLTADRRKRIGGLLKAGHTVDALTACVREYAREAKATGDGQWLNGDSNWRPDNVARTLGRIGSKPKPTIVHTPAVPVPPRRKFL